MKPPQLLFLGPPRFTRDDAPVDLPPAKGVAILAYLAVTPVPQMREALQALLWPESFAEAARKNLRNTLWAIRKALGENTLRVEDDRLALDDSAWVDIWEFERLAVGPAPAARRDPVAAREAILSTGHAALALYRGTFLEGLAFGDAPDFELWLAAERERLEQVYLRVVGTLLEAERGAGNWPAAIALAHRALARDPLQEPIHRALMEAHARLGERPEALRQYETLRATLDRELGVAPLPETAALRAAILDGDLLPARAAVPAGSAPRPPAAMRRAPAATPFVGRQAEQAVLDTDLARAAGGQVRVVLLTGEVGLGKSRLWQEWAASLAPDQPVLESRCLESTQALPFAPLTMLFGSPAYAPRLFAADSPVSPIWLAELARLLPEGRVARPDLPLPAALPPEEERRRVFEAFTQCLLALGGRPVVFFLDDAHWADRATLDWLDYLVHRLPAGPLLLGVAYRPEDAPAALAHLLAGWGREGLTTRLTLARLTPDESAALLAAVGGDPALAERAQAQGAGNPYFLIELARAAPAEVPPALAELVRARLARLPEAARQVLQAAAVLEPDIDFGALSRVGGHGEEETLDALDTLLGAGLLVERGTHYEFAHPLVAAVVREEASAARRAFLHRRAAEALEALHPSNLAPIAGPLAVHYAQAGDPARAARYAEQAAVRALTLAAPDEAVAFYRQALALEPTPARQMGLGRALLWHGDLAATRAAFEAAVAGFAAQGDRAAAGNAALDVAETYLPAGRADEAARWVEQSLAYLDGDEDPAAHARAHFLIGSSHMDTGGSLATAESHLLESVGIATDAGLPDLAARGRFSLGNLLAQRGDLPAALASFHEAIALAQHAGDQIQEVLGHNNLAYHAILAGDLATAQAEVTMGLALAEARGLRLPLQYLYSTRGELALAEGDPDTAETWFRRGVVEAERNGNTGQVATYHANLGQVARARGDRDTALLLLEEARSEVAKLPLPYLQAQIDLWLAELYQERGECAAAAAALAAADARLAGREYRRLAAGAARLRAAAGQTPAALPGGPPGGV